MFKFVHSNVWAYDAEWVPDPVAGRLLYDLPADMPDHAVMQEMWKHNGATDAEPTPYLKTVLCRVVSIAYVRREVDKDGNVALSLISFPLDPSNPSNRHEHVIVGAFLLAAGAAGPQLVGFNSYDSDFKILLQRAVVLGLQAAAISKRPDRPWEGKDYFVHGGDWHIDLKDLLSGWGKSTFKLDEIATLSGIPGKLEVAGNQVAALWREGRFKDIVDYNQHDALTTYLLWLRVAHLAGKFSKQQYADEQKRVEDLILSLIPQPAYAHLQAYLDEWTRLRKLIAR